MMSILDMTLPMHLEEKFAFFVPTEVTPTVIHVPVPEVSVIGVVLEAPTVRLPCITKTLKTA
jgi:hypothetical protein